MRDLIDETARSGLVIFHEEVARDGAQGKTLIGGKQRVSLARRHSELFGKFARHQLVFNAGFPSASKDEYESVRQVVSEVDCCYVGASGRATMEEADLLIKAVKGAAYGRISIAVPTSGRMCSAMMHASPEECLNKVLNIISYIRDKDDVSVIDVALMDAARADISFTADSCVRLTENGASMVIACDTVGGLFPSEACSFFSSLKTTVGDKASLVAHMHNDLGFGLINTLTALSCGIRGITSSWLGLGERAGMPATEQLLFLTGHEPEKLPERLNVDGNLWTTPPDLKLLVPVARYVSQVTRRPLLTTDPIVGNGVNSLSTGTPFVDLELFQPYDPEQILGVDQRIFLTPLASKRIIVSVACRLGLSPSPEHVELLMDWVKRESFDRGIGVIDEADFLHFARKIDCPRSA
ncbi:MULTISPECIES: isopropylmalate/homocitrate/citramalate synthase [unclassified Bradyrhizobium]|uniref:isopropylmalate/homocitrate/citramalate synthase n=1 Tax=unclassified Bradyrhizobium TaxID=2631580 RepID=UPI0029161251|nr:MULTISPECIES: isopropylmalate/homocitrate/citramalate synthase [unclassified Bradyrhizobium]